MCLRVCISVGTKWEMMDQLRADIRDFRDKQNLDKVIILWTANTERFCDVTKGLNETGDELLKSIRDNKEEVSPSTIFAVASILEGVSWFFFWRGSTGPSLCNSNQFAPWTVFFFFFLVQTSSFMKVQ